MHAPALARGASTPARTSRSRTRRRTGAATLRAVPADQRAGASDARSCAAVRRNPARSSRDQATSIAPSSAPRTTSATAAGDPDTGQGAVAASEPDDVGEPPDVGGEERLDRGPQRRLERALLGGEHGAEAQPLALEHVDVRARRRHRAGRPRWAAGRRSRRGAATNSAVYRASTARPEIRLGREVVVQGGLREPELGRDVGVAHAVEPAGLDEPCARSRIRVRVSGVVARVIFAHLVRSARPALLTLTYW